MQNNVNTFNAAKMNGAKDQLFQQRYNYLIDILSQQIKILNASINGGLTITNAGILTLGNELEALQALSDAAGFVTKTGDGTYAIDASDYQPLNNELTALSNLADTAGFVKKTGDGTYSIDITVYATDNDAIAYAIALGG